MNQELQFEIQHTKDITNPNQLGEQLQPAITCISNAFDGKMPYQDIIDHLVGDHVFIALEPRSRRFAGIACSLTNSPAAVFKTPTLPAEIGTYLAATAVDPVAQGKGVYIELMKRTLSITTLNQLPVFFLRTQNPRVHDGAETALFRIQNEGLFKSFQTQMVHIPGAYGSMLTEHIPKSRRREYSELDYSKGDAFILLFFLEYFR